MTQAGFSATASRCWKLPCVESNGCDARQPKLQTNDGKRKVWKAALAKWGSL